MFRKAVSGIMLMLMLVGVFASAFNLQRARCETVITVVVPGTAGQNPPPDSWADSGVSLSSGDIVSITATGSVSWDGGVNSAGPDGDPSWPSWKGFDNPVLPGAPVAALIAKIGGGPIFLVGSGPTTANGQGELILAVNDQTGAQYNNIGSFAVTITHTQQLIHDVATVDVTPFQSSVTVGDAVTILVTAKNLGDYTETFPITAYYGLEKTPCAGPCTAAVTLDPKDSKPVTLQWDTTGVAPGSYQIWAYASPVSGETNLDNNWAYGRPVNINGLPYKPLNLKAHLEAPYSYLPENPLSRICLTWSPPAGKTPSSYFVFRGTSPDSVSYVTRCLGPTYEGAFPDVNEVYYYRVSAVFSEGQSIMSDPVALGSLEGTNGIENEVNVQYILAGVPFTVQQNFKIPRGEEGYYWVQNVLYVSGARSKDWMAGQIMIFNYTKTADLRYESTNWVLGKPWPISTEPSLGAPFTIHFGGFMAPFVLRATIDGTTLSIENPCLLERGAKPYTFEVPAGSYISAGLPAGNPLYANSPEIDLVSNPYTQLLVPVSFLEGSGKVNSYVRHSTGSGNMWYLCDDNEVDKLPGSCTAETSIGLEWDSSGYFQHAVANDQGLRFAPSYDLAATVPEVKPSVPLDNVVIDAFCPVYLNLFDSKGNMCGYNLTSGLIENQVAPAICISNETILLIKTADVYTLAVVGIEDGDFTLTILTQNETGDPTVLYNATRHIEQGQVSIWKISGNNSTDYQAVAGILGDINLDWKVDIRDIGLVSQAFGSSVGKPRWNPQADVYQDGKVDIRDVALVARDFGEHYP